MTRLAYRTRQLLRNAMIKHVTDGNLYNVAVTLQFNQLAVSARRYEWLARRFGARVSEALLRKNYGALTQHRAHGIYFVEHEDTNTHLHGMLKLPHWRVTDAQIEATQVKSDRCWSKLVPAGSIMIKQMHDANGWAEYITKEFTDQQFFDRFFYTDDRTD